MFTCADMLREDGYYTARVNGRIAFVFDDGYWEVYSNNMNRLAFGYEDDAMRACAAIESFVYDPADPTAYVQGMDKNAKKKQARRKISQWIDLVDRLEVAKALERNTVIDIDTHGGKPEFDDDEQWAFPYMYVDYRIRGYYDDNGVDASYDIKASVHIEEGKGFHQSGYESVSATLWFVDDKIDMPDVAEMIVNVLTAGTGGYDYWTNVDEVDFLFSDGVYGWPEGEDAWLMRIADYIADRIDYDNAMGVTAQNYSDAPRTPEDVDSKGVDEVCPLCGSDSYDGEICSTCGYEGSPEGFDDIALDFEVEEEELNDEESENNFDDADVVEDDSEDEVDDESDDENDENDESDWYDDVEEEADEEFEVEESDDDDETDDSESESDDSDDDSDDDDDDENEDDMKKTSGICYREDYSYRGCDFTYQIDDDAVAYISHRLGAYVEGDSVWAVCDNGIIWKVYYQEYNSCFPGATIHPVEFVGNVIDEYDDLYTVMDFMLPYCQKAKDSGFVSNW